MVRQLAEHGEDAKLIAGGQSLLILIYQGFLSPGILISTDRAAGLDEITYDDAAGLGLGAAVTQTQIASSPLIRERYASLAQAAEKIASAHVRNLGTVGGNVCHAAPTGESSPALLALGASVKAVSPRGERIVDLDGFFRDSFETALEPDEMVSRIIVPPPAPSSRSIYLKHSVRAVDQATVGVGISCAWDDDGRCRDVRIGLTGAGPTPMRAKQAEAVLKNERLTTETMTAAGEAAANECDPLSDGHASASYRRRMVAVFVRRALDRLQNQSRPERNAS
jgi:carbon-monoxide dehydrogenase medium subunit